MLNKVLITGGTGFVGKEMHDAVPKGIFVTPLNHETYDLGYWKELEWDAVVHLAPISPAEVLKEAKKRKARLLYASSGVVYQPQVHTLYRRNKRAWELDCIVSGVDVVIARLFTFENVVDETKAYYKFTQAAKKNEPIFIWGDGMTTRSYMSGEEMGRWMWAILLNGKSGEAYDVGSDMPITMLELAENIKQREGSKSDIIIQGGVDPMPYYMPVDTEKTRKLLSA